MSEQDPRPTQERQRVIKRYTNRKLYDTEDSRYVTLDEIATLVKAGEDVRIHDNRSGEDLTEVTLAQILFEEQKQKKQRMSLELLRDMIRNSGETVSGFFQKRIAEPVISLREEAERRVDEIVRRSEASVEEKARAVREFFSQTQRTLDEIQKKFDDRIQLALSNMPGVRKQLESLRLRIEELEARLKGRDEPKDDD